VIESFKQLEDVILSVDNEVGWVFQFSALLLLGNDLSAIPLKPSVTFERTAFFFVEKSLLL